MPQNPDMQQSGNGILNLSSHIAPASRPQGQPSIPVETGEEFHPEAGRNETGTEDVGETSDLTPAQRQQIIKEIIAAPEEVRAIQSAWEKQIPENTDISYRRLKAAIHPDRFPNIQEKDEAQKAFQSKKSIP